MSGLLDEVGTTETENLLGFRFTGTAASLPRFLSTSIGSEGLFTNSKKIAVKKASL